MFTKLIRIMLKPVKIYCNRPSLLALIEDVKKRNRLNQTAHFAFITKAYIPTNTDAIWYISDRPPSD
jgi:hypothetical protein